MNKWYSYVQLGVSFCHMLFVLFIAVIVNAALQPVTLRSAVLTAFVEIVVEVYKGNLPEGSHRRARDRLLLRLQVGVI